MIIIKYRTRPTIIQSQLDDFIGPVKRRVYRSWVPREYRLIRKRFSRWVPVKSYRQQAQTAKNTNKRIDSSLFKFLPTELSISFSKPAYLFRFYRMPVYTFDNYAFGNVNEYEWHLMNVMMEFNGFFDHIFKLNDFSFLDDLQESLEGSGVRFRGIFVHDAIAFEFLRLLLGFDNYAGLDKVARFIGINPLFDVLRDPAFYPRKGDISHVMTRLPPDYLKEWYYMLVEEAIELEIIVPRVLLWDTQFIRSNCSNNKTGGRPDYNDPDAGYGRHQGRKDGVGYRISNLYAYCGSWERTYPVHFEIVPANRNENPVFRETLSKFLARDVGTWKLVIADTGAYSKQNLDFCLVKSIWPLIRAKKNLKTHPTAEFRKGYWINTDYIPPGWSLDDVRDAYVVRPAIEAAQSANNTFYNASRMNSRGIDNAVRGRCLIYILDLLRAITAVKMGRPDLASKLEAFTTSRVAFGVAGAVFAARDSGYEPLPVHLSDPDAKKWLMYGIPPKPR